MKENGERTRPTAEANSGMLMATSMKENGRMIYMKDMVHINGLMGENLLDYLKMVIKMVKELNTLAQENNIMVIESIYKEMGIHNNHG